MPHYRNGSPASRFDLVICKPNGTKTHRTVGIVVSIQPGTNTCNANMLALARQYDGEGPWFPVQQQAYPECITLGECDLAAFADGGAVPGMAQAMRESAAAPAG